MDDQAIMGQDSDHIDKGKFEACIQRLDSESKSEVGLFESIGVSMENKMPSPSALWEALDKAMDISIKGFIEGDSILPELLNRSKNIIKARDALEQCTDGLSTFSKSKVVLATVDGEDHTHWRDVVRLLFKGLGVKTIDLGNRVSIDQVVQSVKTERPNILGITVSSTSIIPSFDTAPSAASTPAIKKVVHNLSHNDCRDNVTIIVGGAVAGIKSANAVGADYCCENMLQSIILLYKLSGKYSAIRN